jgi:hypothetical protein
MIVHCIKRLADSWKIPLFKNVTEIDKLDSWSLTYGNYNRKRYYILAHEVTMWGMLFFELTPKNFKKKVDEKLKFWSTYYGFHDLSKAGILNTDEIHFCKNNDRSVTGMLTRFRDEIWYFFDDGVDHFNIELNMHDWIFLPIKGKPIKLFTELIQKKLENPK